MNPIKMIPFLSKLKLLAFAKCSPASSFWNIPVSEIVLVVEMLLLVRLVIVIEYFKFWSQRRYVLYRKIQPNPNLCPFISKLKAFSSLANSKQPISTLPNSFWRILTYQDLSFSIKKLMVPWFKKFHYETPNIVE